MCIHIHIDTHIHTNIQSEYITNIEEGVMNLRMNGLGELKGGRRSINLVLIYEILKDRKFK